jgi:hypothetical protein
VATTPSPRRTSRAAPRAARAAALSGAALDEAILRHLRRLPNEEVDLAPLAAELGVEPAAMQLEVEVLGRRGLVRLPFVEPGPAGGALLTEKGLRWLIAREGGRPKDVPVAFKPARKHVRPDEEAERLPRSQVYGVRRPS